MAFQRALWHSGLTYQQICFNCHTLVRYTDHNLDFRPWYPDGFVYCPRCRNPLNHRETYAVDANGNYIKSASSNGAPLAPVVPLAAGMPLSNPVPPATLVPVARVPETPPVYSDPVPAVPQTPAASQTQSVSPAGASGNNNTYCMKCGTPYTAGQNKFCYKCGNKLAD